MKERPIIFSTPMVQAILAGKKTMTRRLSGLLRINLRPNDWAKPVYDPADGKWVFTAEHGHAEQVRLKCPYGQPGDHLWLRERFMPAVIWEVCTYLYYADGPECYEHIVEQMEDQRWKPSIHMPRSASRITLEITNVRVERLNDISEQDAIAEGVEVIHMAEQNVPVFRNYLLKEKKGTTNPIHSFDTLWKSINGPDSWQANPWVWVIEFKVL